MSETEILILGRVIERILIVLICGASLGFGWNLFREGIVKTQEAEFSKGHWKFALKQVGPGVFFALFACVGLVFSVISPLSLGPRSDSKSGDHILPSGAAIVANYDVPATGDRAARDEIKAINTLTTLWQSDHSPNTPKPELVAADQAVQMLLERKEKLLLAIFPQDYTRYKEIRSKVATHPEILSGLTQQERTKYDLIDHASDDGLNSSSR